MYKLRYRNEVIFNIRYSKINQKRDKISEVENNRNNWVGQQFNSTFIKSQLEDILCVVFQFLKTQVHVFLKKTNLIIKAHRLKKGLDKCI